MFLKRNSGTPASRKSLARIPGPSRKSTASANGTTSHSSGHVAKMVAYSEARSLTRDPLKRRPNNSDQPLAFREALLQFRQQPRVPIRERLAVVVLLLGADVAAGGKHESVL